MRRGLLTAPQLVGCSIGATVGSIAKGGPERVTLDYDHKTSFLSMTFLGFDRTTQRAVEFLDAKIPVPTIAAPPLPSTVVRTQPQ
jgi:hypothetical protein